MPYFATGNLDHNNQEFKRGQEITDLSDKEAQQLLELGAITENAEDIGGVVASEQLPEVVSHPNPTGEIQPSLVPHPVEAEQARIESDFENRQVAEAAAPAPTPVADQGQPVQTVQPVGQPQIVQPVGQPTPEEIAQTLANENGGQPPVQQSQV